MQYNICCSIDMYAAGGVPLQTIQRTASKSERFKMINRGCDGNDSEFMIVDLAIDELVSDFG